MRVSVRTVVVTVSVAPQSSTSVSFVLEALALGNLPIRINAVTPVAVGLSDAVVRNLLVKPEGFEQELVVHSVLDLVEGLTEVAIRK